MRRRYLRASHQDEREREGLPWRFETPFIINANVRAIPFAAFYFTPGSQLNNPIRENGFISSRGAFRKQEETLERSATFI